MKTLRHIRVSIEGAIRNKAFSGWMQDGVELTRKQAEDMMRHKLAMGEKYLACGDCEGFSPLTGCPGHRVEDDKVTASAVKGG